VKLAFPEHALRPVGEDEMERAREAARGADRRRGLVRFHDHDEPVQRMLNAVEPDSYVRPHRHRDPAKTEVFLALAGRACVCRFDDAGTLVESLEIAATGPRRGVEIPPGVWHALVSLEPGTVLYEVIEGPYSPASHKEWAPWAPEEGGPGGSGFLRDLRERIARGRSGGGGAA
jgi:cupin fold WbuC family metalloprotein